MVIKQGLKPRPNRPARGGDELYSIEMDILIAQLSIDSVYISLR